MSGRAEPAFVDRPRPLQRRPQLRILVPLESDGEIMIDADSREDEMRLRQWLSRSPAFQLLPGILETLLDDLDEHDRESAA